MRLSVHPLHGCCTGVKEMKAIATKYGLEFLSA